MAKGDRDRVQKAQGYGNVAQNYLQDYRQNELHQNQNLQNRYTTSADLTESQYRPMMEQWQNFARTGGFSPEDLANIRARSISPIRSIYSNAQGNLQRQKALTGGYMPNYGAASAKMSREMSNAAADASTNAEAMIAEILQRGRLAGMQGGNQLYGTTPGQTAMYGQQVSQSNQRLLNFQQLQNQLAMDRIRNEIAGTSVPGNFQQGLGNAASIFGLGGSIANMFRGGGGHWWNIFRGLGGGGASHGDDSGITDQPLPGSGDTFANQD